MAAWLDGCRFTPTLGGTTDWTYSAAVLGYQSPALAGVVNGTLYKYRAESADLTQWELGEGAYNTSTGVLARTTVLFNSSGTGTAAGQSGAGSKINFSTVPQVAVVALKEDLLSATEANSFSTTQKSQVQSNIGVRPVVTGPPTYYVLTTGSDSNNGLTNTSGGAFLTIQKAINTILMLDLAGFNATVQVGPGTYANGFSLATAFVGGNVQVIGDTTTPSNVVIAPTAGGNPFEVDNVGSQITIAGFKMVTSGGAIQCYATNGGFLQIGGKMEFGAATSGSHLAAVRGGQLIIGNGTAYTISGSANFHYNINGGSIFIANLNTVTLTGTPAFSIFAQIASGAIAQISGTSFTGAATGTKNTVSTAGGVDTGGGFAVNTLFPGSVAGTTTSPGWWS